METENNSGSASRQNGIESNSTPSYAQAVSNCWNTPTSAYSVETSSSCLLCFENEVSRADQPSSSGRSKLLKNFCDQLQLNSAEIPEECDKIMFPFCETCETELDLMFEHTQIILKSQSMISMMARKLEKKVIQKVGNWTDNPVHPAGEKLTKLWNMIMEGYGKRQSEEATRHTESSHSGHNDAEQEPDQMETNNPEGETVTVNVNPEACSISVAVKKEHCNIEHQNDEEDLESDDEIQQVSMLQKRRTLCEGVEYWERIRRPGNERYLQCSRCPHTVPNNKKCKRGELTPYKTLALHMQAEHKTLCKKKGNNNRPGTSSKRATTKTTKGGARKDSKSDPQPSTSRNQLNQNGIEAENGNADGNEHYVLKARKRKYTFMSVEILMYIGTRNPDNKYLKCERCQKTFPVIPWNKKGEVKAYKKIKKHIEKNHRDKRKKITSAAPKDQEEQAFQSEQTRVKVENPLNSGTLEGDDGGEIVGMPPVPEHPFTQPSAVDGDEMPGVGDKFDEAVDMSMMTPSPAPHSPFYNYVYGSGQ